MITYRSLMLLVSIIFFQVSIFGVSEPVPRAVKDINIQVDHWLRGISDYMKEQKNEDFSLIIGVIGAIIEGLERAEENNRTLQEKTLDSQSQKIVSHVKTLINLFVKLKEAITLMQPPVAQDYQSAMMVTDGQALSEPPPVNSINIGGAINKLDEAQLILKKDPFANKESINAVVELQRVIKDLPNK
jgi:hypothetical protein